MRHLMLVDLKVVGDSSSVKGPGWGTTPLLTSTELAAIYSKVDGDTSVIDMRHLSH